MPRHAAKSAPRPRTSVEPALDEDACWNAVCSRDATYDRRFVYAVSTTGIYCRPACPSRRANREHVTFFNDSAAATRAGYRACKRCKPDAASQNVEIADKIAAVCRVIETAEQMPQLAGLAALTGLSPFHFHRVFKRATGVTPKAYGAAHRNARLRNNLKTAPTVTAAVFDAGFNSSGRFYSGAKAMLGMTPGRYKAGGAGTVLNVIVTQCSLGALLVAATQIGVAAILIGDDPDELRRDLHDRFPKATLSDGDAAFQEFVSQVIALVEHPGMSHDLPLDVRGTAFQYNVWKALQAIPPGATASYRDIAERIGSPKAVRAVAGACAANPVAVAIPCHRVVRTDGEISGYRWGVGRKRTLLDREAKNSRRKT